MSERVVVSVSLTQEEFDSLIYAMQEAGYRKRSTYIRDKILSFSKSDSSELILMEIRRLSDKISQGAIVYNDGSRTSLPSSIDESTRQEIDELANFFSFVTNGDES